MARLPDVVNAGPIDLCRWREDDVEDVVAALTASIDDLSRWMSWAVDGVPSVEEQRELLRLGEAAFEDGLEFGYLMREVETGELVGGAALMPRVGPGGIEIGYWVRSDRHRRGYATAATRALTALAFERLAEVERVELYIDEANTRSEGVPTHLGYVVDRTENHEREAPAQSGRRRIWVMHRDQWGQ